MKKTPVPKKERAVFVPVKQTPAGPAFIAYTSKIRDDISSAEVILEDLRLGKLSSVCVQAAPISEESADKSVEPPTLLEQELADVQRQMRRLLAELQSLRDSIQV